MKKRLTKRGLVVLDHLELFDTWIPLAARLLANDWVRTTATVVDGLEAAPEAFVDVLWGAATGKMLVRLA